MNWVFPVSCLTSCFVRQTDEPLPAEPAPHASTYVYKCTEGSTFVTGIVAETAWLFLPTGTVNLPHAPSGSGAKFSDGKITFYAPGSKRTTAFGSS